METSEKLVGPVFISTTDQGYLGVDSSWPTERFAPLNLFLSLLNADNWTGK